MLRGPGSGNPTPAEERNHEFQTVQPGRSVRGGGRHPPRSAGPGGGGGPTDLPAARRARQPVRPPSAGRRGRRRVPRRDPGLQPGRVGRGHDRLLQGEGRAGQPQLPLRGPRAALRDRQRRPRDAGLRAGPLPPGGGGPRPGDGGPRRPVISTGTAVADHRRRVGGARRAPPTHPLRRGVGLLVPRPGVRAPVGGRHLRAVHRGHDRHAQGRALAPGGHLLRRHGRRGVGGGADHPGRCTGRSARPRRVGRAWSCWWWRRSCTAMPSG